ncbi:TetR/AcrR family transcriptional regulator [Streptomyces sp. CMB-StM0423]|uniref:TetR/AcrR family transcriptional regulator n=1 Tax=Streptomyces sp. CMB-StM0423 TaxID=2059884 RepID=UPI001F30A17E|nr:TetR/AcrR family transcriptional regulator [Streptomyces sp. CMB-StM0423]
MSPQTDTRSSGLERGPDPRAVRSRAAALDAARALLVEQGWAAVTHVSVAARSGVGRTTLYRHWPDPAEMIRDAITEGLTIAHVRRTGELRRDLLGELNVVRRWLHDPTAERALRAVIERVSVDPAYGKLKTSLHTAASEGLRAIVDTARERGELPAGLDTDLAVDQLSGPLMFRRLVAERTFDGGFVESVVDFFLSAYDGTSS